MIPAIFNQKLGWVGRLVGAGSLAIPKTTRFETGNPAGASWGHVTSGQLVLLGYKVSFLPGAATDGVTFLDVRASPAPLSVTLFSVLASSTARVSVSQSEIWMPLRSGRVTDGGATVIPAGSLNLALVGSPTDVEVVAWGIYSEEPMFNPLSATGTATLESP